MATSAAIALLLVMLPDAAEGQAHPRWASGMVPTTAALKADGRYLQATPFGQLIPGPQAGAGTWEMFRIYNETNPGGPIRFGDIVIIGSHTGEFVGEVGNNPLRPLLRAAATSRSTAQHFMVESLGLSSQGREVGRSFFRLRSASAPDPYLAVPPVALERIYLSLSEVGADLSFSADAAKFQMEPLESMLVRIRRGYGLYLAAENGGGGLVNVNRVEPGPWESFRLYNLTRPGQPSGAGDTVAIQTLSGSFLELPAAPPGVTVRLGATASVMAPDARFTVVSATVDLFGGGSTVMLRPARRNDGLLAARDDGSLVYVPSPRTGDDTRLLVLAAKQTPSANRFALSRSVLPDSHPLRNIESPGPMVRTAVVLATEPRVNATPGAPLGLDLSGNPVPGWPQGLDATEFRKRLFRDPDNPQAFTVEQWLTDNTGGEVRIVPGPTPVVPDPPPLVVLPGLDPNGQDRIARGLAAGLGQFATGGLIDSGETLIFATSTTANASGQFQPRSNPLFCCAWVWVNAALRRDRWVGLAAHETSHFFWGQDDRYGAPQVLRRRVVARFDANRAATPFQVERADGVGTLAHGDLIRLHSGNDQYVKTSPARQPFPDLREVPAMLDFPAERDGAAVLRVLLVDAESGTISNGSQIRLVPVDATDEVVFVPTGGHNPLHVGRAGKPEWATFLLETADGRAPGHGSWMRLISAAGAGDPVVIDPENRNNNLFPDAGANGLTPNRNDVARGYIWGASNGDAGPTDNANNHAINLISAYDRARRGWAELRYLTPAQRGCYQLDAFLLPEPRAAATKREILVLFDPRRPKEWYTVELRLNIPGRDSEPSDGFYVNWHNMDENYWRPIHQQLGDQDAWTWSAISPALVSAAVPGLAANALLRPIWLDNAPMLWDRSAFNESSKALALPTGDGTPSNFVVSFGQGRTEGFSPRPIRESGRICIH